MAINKPFGLIAAYKLDAKPAELQKPFDLTATYDQNAGSTNQNINGIGFYSSVLGSVKAIYPQFVKPISYATNVFGQTSILNKNKGIFPGGLMATGFGNPLVKNVTDQLFPPSISGGVFGRPTIYNLRQYLRFGGMHTAIFGTAYVQGGVKFVFGYGYDHSIIPNPKVVNTRADQYVDLRSPSRGIAPPTIDRPNVSPRILYPMGILPGAFGTAWVQRNPSPKGFTTDSYGNAWVSHSPRYLTPFKVEAFLSGYAKVFDPTKKVAVSGVNTVIAGGIFGDIAIRNKRRFIRVTGSDQSDYGNWSSIFSNLTKVLVQSFDAAVFGNNTIWNKTPSVIPGAWDSNDFGQALIADRIRRINARGIDWPESQRFGKHVLTKPPEIKLAGFNAMRFGEPWVSNKTREIPPPGMNTLRFSEPLVWFRYRHLSATGIGIPGFAQPKVEHGLRFILGRGDSHLRFGSPTVWFKVRKLIPSSIYREFESKHLIGGTQFVKPSGYVASEFGNRIVPENQSIYGLGFSSQGFSDTNRIELHTRWVRATGFLTFGQQTSERYGTAKIWNKRQYVNHNYDSGDGLNPGGFGQWNAIANRNREMKVSGFDAARFGYQQIDNNARPLLPLSFMPGVFGTAMIADRIRRLRLDGMEAPYMSAWGRVHNAAFLIAPISGKHDQYGHPTVANTRREYRWVGAFESMLFGQAMVAFRIRKLSIESRYGINPIYMPLPKVELRTRYIEPIGIDRDSYGGPSLYIKWNILTTRWTHRELFGDAFVKNLTPELKQRGANSEEFGKPSARLQWDKYPVEGFGNEIFGRQLIAFRDRSMMVSGFNAFNFGRVTVTKTGAPPYSLQTITLDWDGEGPRPDDYSGKGIEPPERQVSIPTLKTNVIFTEGFVATRFGNHHAQSNGILVEPGIQQFAIGDHIVGLKNRSIQVPTLGDFGIGIGETRPSISPHTIYAVIEAPAQAIQNHYKHGRLHYVNSDNGNRAPGEVFGNARVTLRHRQIYLHGYNYVQGDVGTPSLQLRKRYVRPTGINMFRMGWHSALDGSPQDLVQYNDAAQTAYGRPSVVSPYYGPQTVRVSGLNAFNSGSNRVEFFHRPVYPRAFLATAMGASRSGDTPYKPQGLWVGKPMPTIPLGFNSERFGNTTIGLRVRDISVEGFDSFASELDISNFKGRLKVTLVKQPIVIESQYVAVMPFVSETRCGIPDVKLKVHYIRPDGNSNQYRKGGLQ